MILSISVEHLHIWSLKLSFVCQADFLMKYFIIKKVENLLRKSAHLRQN
ncbi:unnamed protein product [Schistosoma mattheei]|uniref:Uncharacterized protein n=1 Tax=Schistosoma mattheei TaxID=31246 RepID=A0A3P7YFA6_9TREM|nr:unnamed protein product [Schistosoma mattheei]